MNNRNLLIYLLKGICLFAYTCPWLAWKSLCRPGLTWTCIDPPPASQVTAMHHTQKFFSHYEGGTFGSGGAPPAGADFLLSPGEKGRVPEICWGLVCKDQFHSGGFLPHDLIISPKPTSNTVQWRQELQIRILGNINPAHRCVLLFSTAPLRFHSPKLGTVSAEVWNESSGSFS